MGRQQGIMSGFEVFGQRSGTRAEWAECPTSVFIAWGSILANAPFCGSWANFVLS